MNAQLDPPKIVRADGPNVLDVMARRWSLQILIVLERGEQRFSDLRRALPAISANILTARLRDLASVRLIVRCYIPPPAASHVYALGPEADALKPALFHFARWQSGLSARSM